MSALMLRYRLPFFFRTPPRSCPSLCRRRTPPAGRPLSTTAAAAALTSRRSNSFNSGFTSQYDPEEAGRGPLHERARHRPPTWYPRDLKKRLDEYVVGQEKPKKILATALFNHVQIANREQEHEHDVANWREKQKRQELARQREFTPAKPDDFRDDFRTELPPHHETPPPPPPAPSPKEHEPAFNLKDDPDPKWVRIRKNNILVMGHTGSGKTYLLDVASKELDIPMATVDCTSLTQAGYVGQDVETCIQRLLIEANYDVSRAESGIVVFDEVDKLAKKKDVSSTRDVAGEGVQQGLLKLIEGHKVVVSIKDNYQVARAPAPPAPPTTAAPFGNNGTTNTLATQSTPTGKVEQQYIVNTENILFVMIGAFGEMDKSIKSRLTRSTMGFMSPSDSATTTPSIEAGQQPSDGAPPPASVRPRESYLDLTTPEDLQKYGFIPELIGRVSVFCPLTPLTEDDLYTILTGPRNNLVAQYKALFRMYPSTLAFTTKALRAIAKRAAKNKTGARGLSVEMHNVLAPAMYDAYVPYVLVTEASVQDPSQIMYFGKGAQMDMERAVRDEDGSDVGIYSPEPAKEALRGTG